LALLALALSCSGHGATAIEATTATARAVRGALTVTDASNANVEVGATARIPLGGSVAVSEAGLARLALDSGPQLLLDASAHLALPEDTRAVVDAGRAYFDVMSGDAMQVDVAGTSLRASDAALSIAIVEGGADVYVVRGEVSQRTGDARSVVRAGELLAIRGTNATTSPETLWEDWTGGLVRTGPADPARAPGMGTLEARVPDEVGQARWPLVIRRLDVQVQVIGELAITEVQEVFFNPASETVEGLYRVSVPENAVLERFAVDRNGSLVDGYVREEAQARAAYEAQVYRGSTLDPALLEWDAPGQYRARIYPIAAGEIRRIAIRYAEWLPRAYEGGPYLYRYPMAAGAGAPRIGELSFVADLRDAGASSVRAGLGATVDSARVELRRSDFSPRSDLWMELVPRTATTQQAYRAAHVPPARAPGSRIVVNEADERDYWYLPLRLPERLFAGHDEEQARGLDVVIVADVSAGTDRAHLELGRSVAEAIASHLHDGDRVSIVSSDLTIRAVAEGGTALGPAQAARLDALLDGLAEIPAGGATDLGEAIAQAGALLDPARNGAVVYIGDGAPTVGELGGDALLGHLIDQPHPIRLYAIGVGADANLDLLGELTHGGGLALRVEERDDAAPAAMEVLSHLSRPILTRVSVELGSGIENAFPRVPVDVVRGDIFEVVGRVHDGVPTDVVVRGSFLGTAFEEHVAVATNSTDAGTDLRLRWANERLRQQLREGASREEIAELGTRYGLITPYTSYYVPSAQELSQMGAVSEIWRHIDLVGPRPASATTLAEAAATIALGPLALTACSHASPPSEPEAEEAPEWLQQQQQTSDSEGGTGKRHRDDEGAMGARTQAHEEVANRYGVEAPTTPAAAVAAPTIVAQPPAPPPPAEPERAHAYYGPEGSGATVDSTARMRAAAPATGTTTSADPDSALGALMGDQIGGNFGFGGLGTEGTGRGGGGTGEGTIGLGNLGTIGHGSGTGSGSGYGSGAGGFHGRGAAVPQIRDGNADVRGSLSREIIRRVVRRHINEVRFCYEQELAQRPDLSGRVTMSFIVSATGSVQTASVMSTTLNNSRVESCVSQAVRRWTFPAPDGGGVVGVNYPFTFGSGEGGPETVGAPAAPPAPSSAPSADHSRSRCSDAADLSLDDRRALWAERLTAASWVGGWVDVYRTAGTSCEIRSARDRRAFVDALITRAGDLSTMINVYSYLTDASARGYLRNAILRRVRTPDDLRIVRGAFGGTFVDWVLVDQVLVRATTPAARLRALRGLLAQQPDSFDLRLRLLEELEVQQRTAELRRLAARMRVDPMADAGVRTAIGELYLRLNDEDDARRTFSEIVEFAPLDELARRRLGDLYRAHGWYDDAYRQYETLATIRPDDPSVFLLLAQAAAGAGRTDEALRLEHRVLETAPPGTTGGVARTAQLWSSVRFAQLRQAANGNADQLSALAARMRQSGVLRGAGALRVSLVWEHPDADVALWASHPGLPISRPEDLDAELGIEAFDVQEQESGTYTIEVRRTSTDRVATTHARLIAVWNEGHADEQVEIHDLEFPPGAPTSRWTITGTTMTNVPPQPASIAAPVRGVR
jgi:Ca-activated chloride channel family protein